MIRSWSELNLSDSGKSTATISSTTAPTAGELIGFSSLVEDIYEIILPLLPMTTVCNLLATCTVLRSHYFSLLSEEGKKYFSTIFDKSTFESLEPINKHRRYKADKAKEAFSHHANHRQPHYLLAGLNGERRYSQYHSIKVGGWTILKLRTGTLPISVSELRERQWRWNELKDQFAKHCVQVGLGRHHWPPILDWLEWQILTVDWELGSTLTKCILDERLPLTLPGIGIANNEGKTVSPTDFKRFQSILDIPCIKTALDNDEADISQLFQMAYCSTQVGENDRAGLVEICEDRRMQAAFKSGEVGFAQLNKLFPSIYSTSKFGGIRTFCRMLQNNVIRTLLDASVLTLTQLVELNETEPDDVESDEWWWGPHSAFDALLDIFDLKDIQHHFLSDASLGKQLISLREKKFAYEKDFCLLVIFKNLHGVLTNPIIQTHFTDVEKGKQYLQKIIDLACQQGSWDDHLRKLVYDFYELVIWPC